MKSEHSFALGKYSATPLYYRILFYNIPMNVSIFKTDGKDKREGQNPDFNSPRYNFVASLFIHPITWISTKNTPQSPGSNPKSIPVGAYAQSADGVIVSWKARDKFRAEA